MKKTTINLVLLLIAGVFIMLSCSKHVDEFPAKDLGPSTTGTMVGEVMSMDHLQKAALSIASSATKSTKMIKEVVPLKDYLAALEAVETRSADDGENLPIENVYVVNYENDEGYTILSADTRTDMVLAYSEEGNMNMEKLENPAFREYIELIPVYMEAATASLDSESMGYFGPVERAYKVDEILSYQSPLLTCTEWDQYAPFNDNVPVCASSGTRMPLGCVPIAVLQIMRYWEHPKSYYSYSEKKTISPSWTAYEKGISQGAWKNNPTKAEIARVAYDVAKSCQISFGCDGSSSDIYRAANALNNFGYTMDMIGDYNISRVMTDIRNGQPVFMVGDQSPSGHAWVVDGEQWFKWKYDVYLVQYNTDGSIQWKEYLRSYYDDGVNQMFHVNWGWGGPGINVYTNPNVYTLAGKTYYSLQIIRNLRPR